MRFLDRLKLASHNMWTSKSRTILTILIVFVVSLLIQVVGIACTNFAGNINAFMAKELEESGSSYSINYTSNSRYNIGMQERPVMPSALGDSIHNIIKDDPTAGSVKYSNNNAHVTFLQRYASLTAYDYRSPMADINIIEGRGWNANDYNTNALYIDKNTLDILNLDGGHTYSVGDTMPIQIYSRSNNGGSSIEFMTDYVIKGTYTTQSNGYSYGNATVIMDSTYILNNNGGALTGFSNVEISNPKIDTKNTLSTIILFNKTTKALNAILPTDANGKFESSNSYIEGSMMVIYIDIAIIGLGCVIGFIVLLLSIGSIANTMIISIDKNKKFTGLMMAMGLKPKSIKSVIRLEGAMTIIAGVLLSSLLCMAFIPVFTSVLSKLFGLLTFGEAAFKFTFPFYFPVGVSIIFILMAMLFTRAGVSGLIKQDPITVISEVG